jgi:hypothetical protein
MGGENNVRDASLWICDEDEAWNLTPLFTYTNTHLYKVRKTLGGLDQMAVPFAGIDNHCSPRRIKNVLIHYLVHTSLSLIPG